MADEKRDHFVEDMQLLSLLETHPAYEIVFRALPLVPAYAEGDGTQFAVTLRNAITKYGDESVIGVLTPFTAEIELRQNLTTEERLKNPSVMAQLIHELLVQKPESFLQAVEQYALVRKNLPRGVR